MDTLLESLKETRTTHYPILVIENHLHQKIGCNNVSKFNRSSAKKDSKIRDSTKSNPNRYATLDLHEFL